MSAATNSIRNKLSSIKALTQLTALFPISIGFLLLVPYFIYQNNVALNDSLYEKSNAILNQLALSSEYGLISGNIDYLKDLSIQLLKNETELKNIKVYNQSQELILELHSPTTDEQELFELNKNIYASPKAFDTFDQDDDLHVDTTAITTREAIPQQAIGSITIGVSTHVLKSKQMSILQSSLLLTLIALLLGIIAAYFTSLNITKPLSKIMATVQKISAGNFQAKNQLNNKGEIGQLAQNIDVMANTLKQSKQALDEHIAQLTTAREHAEQANIAKTEFLTLISHEIRTPLNAVSGMLQALEEDTSLNNLQARYTKVGLDAAHHLTSLIDDIMDFSMLDVGNISIENKDCNIKDIIQQIIANFSIVAQQKNLQLSISHHGETTLQNSDVFIDPTRLKQILINLIGNAIKFTPQGTIEVHTDWQALSDQQLQLTISVKDSGIGIAEDELKNIFESFHQTKNISQRPHDGVGLGLAISKQLVELMGGSIHVDSKQGFGSLFSCQFVLDYKAIKTSSTTENTPLPELNNQCRILLVEDNPSNQETFMALFNHYGFNIDIASNGFEGLELSRQQPYDLIFIDCHMPQMNGFDLAKAIRRDDHKHRIPLIAITADILPSTRQKCLDAGMDDFIPKPIRKFDLYSKTAAWLRTREQIKQFIATE